MKLLKQAALLRWFLDEMLRSHMCADNESIIHLRRSQIQFIATAIKVFYRIPDKVNNSSSVSSYALQGKLFKPASSYKPAMAESCNV